LLPAASETAATWSVAVMELGALICVARAPKCAACPVAELCAWRADGYPPHAGPPRRSQTYSGTDRQCRGRILALLRATDDSVDPAGIRATWPDEPQRDRALQSLLDDGLVVRRPDGTLGLP
ncbi:MAG: A/G-specific adenine glycosylase, partial [Nocardioidaceae bacterium]